QRRVLRGAAARGVRCACDDHGEAGRLQPRRHCPDLRPGSTGLAVGQGQEEPAGMTEPPASASTDFSRCSMPQAKLLSFDVFGTLVRSRDGSFPAFVSILRDVGAGDVDVTRFWEFWEERNIAHYWEPYRSYKQICEQSLAEAFAHFGLNGRAGLIQRYFDAFGAFELSPDVVPPLEILARTHRLAIVSNIDDDLLAATPLRRAFDLVCTAERARGYKPDGTLFRYLIAHAGVAKD